MCALFLVFGTEWQKEPRPKNRLCSQCATDLASFCRAPPVSTSALPENAGRLLWPAANLCSMG